jgi:hypothetical protein
MSPMSALLALSTPTSWDSAREGGDCCGDIALAAVVVAWFSIVKEQQAAEQVKLLSDSDLC